jgi:hypothetical protein
MGTNQAPGVTSRMSESGTAAPAARRKSTQYRLPAALM